MSGPAQTGLLRGPPRRPTWHAGLSGGRSTEATRRRPFPSPRHILLTLSSHLTHSNPLALSPPPAASPPASTIRQPHSYARLPSHRSPASTDLGAACCVLRDRAGRTGRASWSTCGWWMRSRSGWIRGGATLRRGRNWIGSDASIFATTKLR